jgi:glycerol-3-phosphate O-acyltransferase/dihydroxyacetone phosphate acyltransferase
VFLVEFLKRVSLTLSTGLSYFHPHKFRSRAVVEFGSPITIPQEYVDLFQKGGKEKREAISKVLDIIFDGLKSVTVRAPDYETLMVRLFFLS